MTKYAAPTVILIHPAYIFVMVKLPEPVHPEVTPLNTQVPLMVALFTEPCKVSVLPLGLPD